MKYPNKTVICFLGAFLTFIVAMHPESPNNSTILGLVGGILIVNGISWFEVSN